MPTPSYVRFWYAIAVAFVACLVAAGASIVYASVVQRQAEKRTEAERAESDRRWCSLLVELDNAYHTKPGPTTDVGRKVADEIHQLRIGFGCPAA
jgi:hypothetical protein